MGYKKYRRKSKKRSGSDGFGILLIVCFGGMLWLSSYIGWTLTITLAVLIASVIVFLLVRRSIPSTPKAKDLLADLQNVSLMSGGQFEVYSAEVLRAMGYKTTVLGGSGDQGVDIIAITNNEKIAIQCKNYKRSVGNKPVQEVYAGAKHHGCDRAWVIAPRGYTKGAHELAKSVGVLLFDESSIRTWIKQIDHAEQKVLKEKHPA